jgi:hypothetical protein
MTFNVLYVGTLEAISAAPSTTAYSSSATYFAAVASNFTYYVSAITFLASGVGFLLLGWLTWKGNTFPNWLSYILLAAGAFSILGELIYVVPFGGIFIGGFLILVTVWALAFGALLLRRPTTAANTS